MVFNEETSQDQLFMPVAGQAVEAWTEYLGDFGVWHLLDMCVMLSESWCLEEL